MSLLAKILGMLRKLIRWYRDPIPGGSLLRVDPLTVLTLIGLATTAWGVGRGLGVEMTARNVAQALRSAPAMLQSRITQAHNNNQISGYDREVALQRVNHLAMIFDEYAGIIESKGYNEAQDALANGMFESLMALGPGEAGGKLVGGLATGKGIDQLVGLYCIGKSIEEFELIATPFSTEEAQLRRRIAEVFGMDADALFKARMRSKINYLRQEWTDRLKENPCQPEQVREEYRAWATQRARIWAEVPRLYGPGEKWATYDAFLDWLIAEARGEGGAEITQTWSGDFDLAVGATAACFACVPPALTGSLDLTINLETCKVSGSISANGEGDTTIQDCDADNQPLEETCTAHGTMKLSGPVTGRASSSGELTLDPLVVTIDHSSAWTAGCDWAPRGVSSETWEDQLTLTGKVVWQGDAEGKIRYATDACSIDGSWDAIPKR